MESFSLLLRVVVVIHLNQNQSHALCKRYVNINRILCVPKTTVPPKMVFGHSITYSIDEIVLLLQLRGDFFVLNAFLYLHFRFHLDPLLQL